MDRHIPAYGLVASRFNFYLKIPIPEVSMLLSKCPFCNSEKVDKVLQVREMMYGTRDVFNYSECSDCHSLWISDEIKDDKISSYYPKDYYSFSVIEPPRPKGIMIAQRDRAELGKGSFGGKLLSRRWPDPGMRVLGRFGLDETMRIADVGCGAGDLLARLWRAGFRKLTGIDPFVETSFVRAGGVDIRKAYLRDVRDEFDVIMFHHSLEHVPDPVSDLRAARERLAPGGRILVRVPVTSSDAYEEFGADWFQLDAPRHLAIPSRQGVAEAAARAGLKVIAEFQDSMPDQFRFSEMYRKDVPLLDAVKQTVDPETMAGYVARAEAANAAGRGDQAAFVLEPG